MAQNIHEGAPHHLPGFITPPGETDTLFVIIVIGVLLIIIMAGNFYFKLHALPEKMAHSANSTQLQLVGVLALLAMFTHNNIFWVAALLLAAMRLPDFSTPLGTIADHLGTISKRLEKAPERAVSAAPDQVAAPDIPRDWPVSPPPASPPDDPTPVTQENVSSDNDEQKS